MTQDMNHTIVKVFRAVFVATMMLTSGNAMADGVVVKGNVYGGGNAADVGANATVNISGGQIGDNQIDGDHGNVFGGGKGPTTTVVGKVEVNIGKKVVVENNVATVTYSDNGTVKGSVYGGSAFGAVNGTKETDWDEDNLDKISLTSDGMTTAVNIYAGTVNGNVYGGGRGEKTSSSDIAAKSFGAVTVIIGDANVDKNITVDGNVYGGSDVNGVLKSNVRVDVFRGTIGKSTTENEITAITGGNVYGGGLGQPTLVHGTVAVNIYGGTIMKDVYGGGALGNTNIGNVTNYGESNESITTTSTNTTIVSLIGGTIDGDVYGGGLGKYTSASDNVPAKVYGDVTVKLNETADNCVVKGSIFGCNNVYGSPQGAVEVHVYGTKGITEKPTRMTRAEYLALTGEEEPHKYDLEAVYGGGNKAAYEPVNAMLTGTDDDTKNLIAAAHTRVIIEGCERSSIRQVYGGGNAASTPGTEVTIKGAYEIEEVFGGGNGKPSAAVPDNNGANVGYQADTDTDGTAGASYGSGKAQVNINGGTIHAVYGGSNTKGNVRIAAVAMLDETSEENCFLVDEAYGGGKSAPMDGRAELQLGCIPGVGNVYGGARAANVNNDVILTITNGDFDNVYGGNNESGTINGSITLNIEETGCRPVNITNLYGGGNLAAYPGPNANSNFTKEITINARSFTTIGNLFGGGYGSTAVVTGDTYVKINQVFGTTYSIQNNQQYTTATTLGTVGNVYGGGSEANVNGNTHVLVGTVGTVTFETGPNKNTPQDVLGANITGSVYGGGLSANVSGDTEVKIGTVDLTSTNKQGFIIAQDIYGGGEGSTTNVGGDVVVEVGAVNEDEGTSSTKPYLGGATISGSVYGGSAFGSVNTPSTTSGDTTTPASGTVTVNLHKGAITGAVYGGGKGQNASGSGETAIPEYTAHVYGKSTVTLNAATVGTGIYGGCNERGRMHGDTEVNLQAGSVGESSAPAEIYGGGLGTNTFVDGKATVNAGIITSAGTPTGTTVLSGAIYGGSALGTVADTEVNLNKLSGESFSHNVFGGGKGDDNTAAQVTGTATVNLNEGFVLAGNIYGGCNIYGETANAVVNLIGGTVGTESSNSNVFGGGKGPKTTFASGEGKGTIIVNMGTKSDASTPVYGGSTLVYGDIYGGSENGSVQDVDVNLYGGTVQGNVYGGGYDTADGKTAANDVTVELYGTVFNILTGSFTTDDNESITCPTTGRVFGCNNLKGSPVGHALVHVYRTASRTGQAGSEYDLAAVFGGGNQADYKPTDSKKSTEVIIEGCEYTSIEKVYGGGNAAAVPATEVWILGTKKIDTVFGGGNGELGPSHAANVGIDSQGNIYSNNTGGSGKAETKLVAGNVTTVYGGSNSNGDVTGGSWISMPQKTEYSGYSSTTSCCDNLLADNIYGGGKNANMSGGTNIILGCQPDHQIDEIYAGSQHADISGDVSLTITSGKFARVFGGNRDGGRLMGSITVNIEETGGCDIPIIIGELYGGGNLAPYSIYGYKNTGTESDPVWAPRESATDDGTGPSTPYDNPRLNVRSFTSIGKIFGGGYKALMVADPTVDINVVKGSHYNDAGHDVSGSSYYSGGTMTVNVPATATTAAETLSLDYPAHEKGKIGAIENVFGGGNLATVIGSATVNIGTEPTVTFVTEPKHLGAKGTGEQTLETSGVAYIQRTDGLYEAKSEGANITGNVYGGGNLADVTGSTEVNICAKEVISGTTTSWQSVSPGTAGVTIAGNVYGGGKGVARESGDRAFFCEEAMVGIDGTNSATNNNSSTYANYGTHVRIGNGTIGNGTTGGNVYGGGEIGRVEFHTEVVIGLGEGTGAATKSPVINGSVFGAGKGTNTHGYSGLVRGDSRVTIQGDAKVGHSVYGGGEMASVGKYEVVNGLPKTPLFGGKCTVTIGGYAEIGPDGMLMTQIGGPDDTGHVFGAGKGTLPYENVTGTPWSMQTGGKVTYDESYTPGTDGLGYEAAYYKFIQSLGLASNSDVTIGGHAFVKGSVYGGSENGYLQANTHVTIAGGQVGAGYDKEQNKSLPKYAETAFIDPSITPVTTEKALATCATWTYDKTTTGNPYDKYAGTAGYDAKGGATTATDGHTYYGNVFGGGRGVVPFAAGKWHRAAGSVAGNTQVDIIAGHILSSVYGGNENTDVGSYALGTDGEPTTTLSSGGTCTINITGGTVGVPRTKEQIEDNPVIGNVFGAGKGDKRVLFNTWTNVGATSVNISGTAKIYGSVFGGGEDGHVIGNAVSIIGGTVTTGVVGNTTEHAYSKVVIGSTGISGADGNVFGGGRGSETALTAGVVGGNVNLTIDNGNILGSVYGGGRLASVGTNFTNPTLENGEPDPRYGELQTPDADHGNIIVTVNDGTIGSSTSTGVNGNIFGGSKGTETNWKLGIARSTTVYMTGGTAYASVYGGGELAQVVGSHTTSDQTLGTEINISGGTIGISGKGEATWGNVYGGGKGNTTHIEAGLVKTNTKVTINSGTNGEPKIYHNIYGGGAYGSVGTITYGNATYIPNQTAAVSNMPTAWERAAEGTTQVNTGTAEVYVYGGTIGTNGNENGMVFGSSRGDVGTPVDGVDPNNRLAWVYNTKVVIGGEGKSPIIYGSVYGSGENGHVFENTQVDIHSGTMGVTTDDSFGGPNYRLRGNVYGGGCGEDTYPGTTGTKKEDFNPLAGIVLGTTNVTIDGGQVVHNVYGAGALGSATNTSVTIAGNAVIGVSGKNGGNVFGAARGKEGITIVGSNLANSIETAVNISGGQIWGSVYGGGETGNVKQDVNVSMTGGAVAKDVYGGGALAHTQTANWDMTNSTWADATNTSAKYKTNVTVSGGTMRDVYGGGLGRVRVAAVAAQGTEGDPDYVPAVAEVTPIEAKVYGDVTVKLNEGVATDAKGAIVNRVFAANNLNGSPQGNTSVYVYATQSADAGHATIGSKFAKHTGLEAEGATSTYDVQAVYGGGNEAAYIPVSPYTAVNTTGAKSQVVIEGCDLTSIKTVYGGGNAASVPETNVTVKSVYEIEDLFGGGNGKDDTSYGKNPGADIGVYKNASNEDVLYGTGNVNATTQGGYIHEIFGASNQKGNIKGDVALNMTQVGDCTLKIDKVYNAGRNADIEGNLISVLSCQPATKIQEYYGGAENANVKGNVELTITNGWFEKVFAGNNQSGAILGHIKLNVEETGCSPIRIDELYGCGNDAAYSIYGYYVQTEQTEAGTGYGDVGETPLIINEKLMLSPRTSADDPHKPVKTFNHEAQTWTVYAGGNSDPYPLYDNPEVNIVSATYIGKVFGGGYGAHGTVYGDPHVNINMIKGDWAGKTYGTGSVPDQLGEIGVVYGGGNEADVVGNTFVNIGTVDKVKLHLSWDNTTYTWSDEKTVEGANITGNVFGGGKGKDDSFFCEKAMIGKDGDGIDHPEGGTHVTIGNGTVMGNVYGGGEIGRVEKNTVVTIGLADVGSGESAPVIKGNVFGGGMGKETHGYAALVRGNPTVTIQADAKVEHNVYGGGQIASVARYNVPRTEGDVEDAIAQGYDAHLGMPYALANTTSGNCHVTVKDNAIIGPDTPMKMYHSEITDGSDEPDDAGHVFGAGKGILPENYTYVDKEHKPKRMVLRDETIHTDAKKGIDWEYVDPSDDNNKNVWEYFANRDAYIIFIQTLALSSYANVTIGDDTSKPFVKGSVYGGSENGLVQFDTKVYIKSGQIGCGKNATAPYGDDVWADGYVPTDDLECASWDYGTEEGDGTNKKIIYAPYDPNANAFGNLDQYPGGKSTEGGRRIASDGHTYYGNVFGGGSGSVPYFDTTEGISKYLNSAGTVKGDTYVEISGGHILTNVYGGCEATNVLGKATVKMTDGSIGVPRTPQQIKDHPVTCYLFGAGKGDQRIYFNKETNVNDAIVNVEGGRIYGSVFGGGEDGHVLRNTTVTIGKTDGTGPKIGTVGSTYVDGNVFGGGRGFGGEALTAGNVGGSVDLIINGGTMLGSVYGGGRLASVGYGLYLVNEEVGGVKPYGKMREDNEYDGSYPDPSPEAASAFYTKGRGHITVNINGGTIGSDVEDEHSGNVFGGSMGRLTKIDGSPFDDSDHWSLLATAKTTEVKIAGGTIKRNVYGGGEMGTVTKDATVTISGGTIGKAGSDNVEIGNVFGGGKGYLDPAQTYVGAGIVKGNTNVAIQNGTSGSTTTTPTIYQNVYGGGELGYVGMFTTSDHKEYTWTENTGLCTVGVAGGMITGHVFGAGKGHDDTFECERAMVRTTSVAVSDGTVGGNVYGGGEVGRVDQNSAVTIGPATGDSAPTITGSVFGAGAGVETHGYSALVRGNTAVVVQGNAKVGNSVYGGGQIAAVGRYGLDGSGMPSTLVKGGECVVTVQGNAVIGANGIGNVFGAGMGVDESKKTYTYADNANRPKRMMTYASELYTDANKLWEFSDATHTYVWEYFDTREKYLNFLQTLALATDTRLTINGNASVNGSVYGGSESGFVQRDTEVKILGGEILTVKDAAGNITEGNVFGGGKGISDNDAAGRVRSDIRITVLDGTINGDVYGGGALGKANTLSATNTTIVNLLGGTINGDVYGGGLGNATTAADVGNTVVNLNGLHAETDVDATTLSSLTREDMPLEIIDSKYYRVKSTRKGAVVKGNIFGANNVNGTPKGHVLVHVHGTQNETTSALNVKVDGLYDVTGVFGGGNASDYVPDAADTKQSTEVIIEGCDLTSIKEVYGGGYGAATPATSVLVKGTKIINNVFGGGYGAGTDNPGANVGYVTGGSRSPYALGTGKAVVQLMAGTVNNVYGGSNTKGDIRSGSNVTNVANDNSPGCCDKLSVQEIYGGGSQADMFGGTEIVLGCMPDDWIGAIYAGAENANVGNDVSLTLTSGKFGRVFGGNKSGGKIDGYIEVNIEENPECSTPIIIGGLYGGGNEAPYTYPLLDKDPNYLSPRVNVRAFTSIGNIYGGGFGATATVTGNPLVNINVVEGGREYAGEDKPLEDGTTVTLHARSKDAKMGVIGNVFGGGNAAPVIGNPRVEVGTAAKQKMLSLQTKDAAGTVHEVEKDVLGADIRGNVYGGGNNAAVTGDPKVVIGQRKE